MSRRFWPVLVVCAAACGNPDPVTLPPPLGPNAVARTTVRWIDEARAETMTDDPADRREVTVHLHSPVPLGTTGLAAPYVADLSALARLLDERSAKVFELVRSNTIAATTATDAFPLIVISPGNDMLTAQYTVLIEELVSEGFAVAAIDPPYDARAVLLANGAAVGPAGERWPPLPPPSSDGRPVPGSDYAKFYRARVETRAADARFVLDRLLAGATALRVNPSRVGYFGHSVGGVTAGEVCRSDVRFRACANFDGESPDGPFYLEADGRAFAASYLMITKPFDVPDAQLAQWGLTRETWLKNLAANRERYFGAVTGGSYRVVIAGATHASFSDEPFVLSTLEDDDEATAHFQRLDLMRRYLVAFFGKHLRGEAAPILDDVPRWPPKF